MIKIKFAIHGAHVQEEGEKNGRRKLVRDLPAPPAAAASSSRPDQKMEIFRHNLYMISDYYGIDPGVTIRPSDAAPILSQVRIVGDRPIGSGVFGAAFLLSNGMVMKIMRSLSDRDQKRFDDISNQVFGGSASLDDMHYFDHGVLLPATRISDKLFYVVMPRIIPFMDSRDYAENPELFDLFSSHCLEDLPSYEDLISLARNKDFAEFADAALNMFFQNLSADFDVIKVSDLQKQTFALIGIIRRILFAAMIAIAHYDGKDLHLGNLGHFPQKPDRFFFFDM